MKKNPFEMFMEDPTRSVPEVITNIEKHYNAPTYSLRELFASFTGEVNLRSRIDYRLSFDEGKLGIPRMQVRGAQSEETMRVRKKSDIYLEVPHYKQVGMLRADDFIGKVVENTQPEMIYDTIEASIAERLTSSWDDYTVLDEYNYVNAVLGKVRDGLYTDKIDIYERLGATQKTFEMDFENADYNPTVDTRLIISYLSKALAGTISTRRVAVCSGSFWDRLITNRFLIDTYKYEGSAFLREQHLEGYSFLGIEWLIYDNETVDDKGRGVKWLPDGDAYVIPYGVTDLFMNVNAPADTMPEITQEAKHRYSNYYLSSDRRTIKLESQTNTITFCTRPEAIIRLHVKGYKAKSKFEDTFVPPVLPEDRRNLEK